MHPHDSEKCTTSVTRQTVAWSSEAFLWPLALSVPSPLLSSSSSPVASVHLLWWFLSLFFFTSSCLSSWSVFVWLRLPLRTLFTPLTYNMIHIAHCNNLSTYHCLLVLSPMIRETISYSPLYFQCFTQAQDLIEVSECIIQVWDSESLDFFSTLYLCSIWSHFLCTLACLPVE